ncbi:MAG: EthD domain-containing protein [Actinomycetota bacterium]|nr:MAG: EthD domain-containing protein [Actinomycetota bacterium]
MIRLIALLKRKPGTTHDEFLEHWLGSHGPLVATSSAARYWRRYEQYPVAWPEPGSDAAEPEFDGVTIQEFDSVRQFWAHTTEADFAAVSADNERFLDVDSLKWVLVEEPHVVVAAAPATDALDADGG